MNAYVPSLSSFLFPPPLSCDAAADLWTLQLGLKKLESYLK